ncbi:MAG: exodeoxyribonuclease VII small subunit [Planctomycetota bacterium]
MTKRESPAGETTYTAASRELEAILDAIEGGDIDIDALSDKVERASALIKICREKLAGTELRVKKVVEDLTATLDDDQDTAEADGDEK